MKKITITNAYTWNNKGDAGILLATIDCLKKVYNEVEVNILSFTPNLDREKYSSDVSIKNVESNILNPHPYKHTKIGKIIAIIKLIIKLIFIQIGMVCFRKKTILKNKSLTLLNDSDIIVVCGGGFLGGKKLDSLMHLYQIYINSLFNKPLYVIGNSIEPINNKFVKRMTDNVLKKVDFIFAREEITEEYLSTILNKNKHCQIPDMAFMLEDLHFEFPFLETLRERYDVLFGITVRDWNFPLLSDKNKAMNNYINALQETLTYYIKEKNACFIFIPQVIVEHGDDAEVAKKIKEQLPNELKERFIIRCDDFSPYEIKSLISQLDYFVGTRMHSNIFATSMKVPTVAIAYEKKTNGIMKTLNLEDYIIEINTITSEKLIKKIEVMMKNNKDIRRHLDNRIQEIRKEIINKTLKVLSG